MDPSSSSSRKWQMLFTVVTSFKKEHKLAGKAVDDHNQRGKARPARGELSGAVADGPGCHRAISIRAKGTLDGIRKQKWNGGKQLLHARENHQLSLKLENPRRSSSSPSCGYDGNLAVNDTQHTQTKITQQVASSGCW